MGDNTLTTVSGAAQASDLNQYRTAITGDFKPRNATSGALEDGVHSLGALASQWKNAYLQNLFLNGQLFDPDAAGAGVDSNNAIVSGATRSGSGQPDFLRASGSGASMTILATTTPLQITANASSVTIEADIAVSSLTVAPGSNNTCLVDDGNLADQASSKYTGEDGTSIVVDTMGTEISSRVGEFVCLKSPDGEYMLGFVESTTEINRVYRGFFFDSSGNPVVRGTLANNDALTLMSLGWVFLDANGSTVDVSYTTPIYDATEPSGAASDDYWFDTANKYWNRYDGADWQQVDRMLIGLVVIDGTNCVATRSFDFTKAFSDYNNIQVNVFSATVVRSYEERALVSVYGDEKSFIGVPPAWDIAADLESGLTEASDTTYFLYVTETGDQVISNEKPYNRLGDLKGFYHPYHSWRCVGQAKNNSSSDISSADSALYVVNGKSGIILSSQMLTTSGTAWDFPGFPGGVKRIKLMIQAFSTDGTAVVILQIGDSGGIETSGYDSKTFTAVGTTVSAGLSTTTSHFILVDTSRNAGDVINGTITLELKDPTTNTWEISGALTVDSGTGSASDKGVIVTGTKSLSSELTQIRLTTSGTPDDGDAGSVNVQYEV